MDFVKGLLIFVVVVAVVAGLGWFFTENNYRLNQHYAPLDEQVRRTTFENSVAFQTGQINNLRSMERDYITAPPTSKSGLASVIVHEADRMPAEQYPDDLRTFVSCLREHQADRSYDCSPGAAH